MDDSKNCKIVFLYRSDKSQLNKTSGSLNWFNDEKSAVSCKLNIEAKWMIYWRFY